MYVTLQCWDDSDSRQLASHGPIFWHSVGFNQVRIFNVTEAGTLTNGGIVIHRQDGHDDIHINTTFADRDALADPNGEIEIINACQPQRRSEDDIRQHQRKIDAYERYVEVNTQ